ncbi:alginate lyase family protein [Pseudoxanthomonas sp. 3HH-4]|uniref:alginate lyase family protein n=1 Tax=Pseudoxanthomonas sp. 3HH-4 TaxID=1690214 RepID=UPI00163ADD32|nr:alginate lyase family protein [Pseudoxanthomonas sp. 3HH-4]
MTLDGCIQSVVRIASGLLKKSRTLAFVLSCSLLLPGAAVVARQTEASRVNLSDVMSYGMWFRSDEGVDRTVGYAEEVMAGRFKPRRDVDYWEFSYPIDWSADPYKEDNWQFLLHSLYMLDPLLIAESRKKDERYIRGALRIVSDWDAFHVPQGRSAKYSWYNMAVGMRSAKIAYLHSRLRTEYPRLLDTQTERMFARLAEAHVTPVIKGDIPLRMTNHGLFQIHGVVAICREFLRAPGCRESGKFVEHNLDRIIAAQFDEEGMHLEHSPAYHRFTLNKLEALAATGWYADFPSIVSVSRKARSNLFWLIDPAGRFWGVGDSIPSEQPGRENLDLPSNECPVSLDSDVHVPSACVVMRRFESGYVSIKTLPSVAVKRASGLFFQGGFHSSVHKHLDDQSFELFELGDRLVVDSGYYGYMAHPMRRYMLSTRAHNTVEIGGKDFSRADSDAYGSALRKAEWSDGYLKVQGRVEHKKLGAVHTRQLLYRPGDWLLVRDWIGGKQDREVVQWFHLNPDVILLRQSRDSASFSLNGAEFSIRSISGCALRLDRGTKSPALQGWYSPTQGVAVPNYALGFVCQKAGALEVALTFSSGAAEELNKRLSTLRGENALR